MQAIYTAEQQYVSETDVYLQALLLAVIPTEARMDVKYAGGTCHASACNFALP